MIHLCPPVPTSRFADTRPRVNDAWGVLATWDSYAVTGISYSPLMARIKALWNMVIYRLAWAVTGDTREVRAYHRLWWR